MSVEIKAVIDKFRGGERRERFLRVSRNAGGVIPQLIDSFRDESSPMLEHFSSKPVGSAAINRSSRLGEALNDLEEEVWQEALDDLVTIASDESSEVLQSARTRQFADPVVHKRFHLWLEEAIQQVQLEMRR